MDRIGETASEALAAEDADRIAAALGANPSFEALGPAQLARLVARGEVLDLAPGARLFAQGEMGDAAYLVLDGRVNVDVTSEAGVVTVAQMGAGALVGEIGAFASTRRTASVVAEAPSRLLRIARASVQELLAESPAAAVSVIGELGQRLQSLNDTIAILTQAARALAADAFEPDMLELLTRRADEFGHFAEVFVEMAAEIKNKRALTQEMAAAAQIQQALLPDRVDAGARAGAFEIEAAMTPARHVGGDFYDYFMIDADALGVAVGDVSGKGVPAAIFMSVSRTVLRTVATRRLPPAEMLAVVNDILAEGNREAMFVTVAFGALDLRTGAFAHASGGHEEVFLTRPDGTLTAGRPTGPALGLLRGARFEEERHVLAPGDTVIFATDRITEAFDAGGEMFGRPALERALSANAHGSASELVRAVSAEVARFVGDHPPSDDLTGLALRYLG